MPKMTTREIRERTIELLRANAAGMRFMDVVSAIAAESPETPVGTIKRQVGEVPDRHPDLVCRPGYGLLKIGASLPPLAAAIPSVEGAAGDARLPRTTQALFSLGFVPAGVWAKDGPHLRCDLGDHGRRSPALYAFVVNGEVVYIGKTSRSLGQRFVGYCRPGPTQQTNIENNRRLRETLESGLVIDVWVLVDWEPLEHRGVPVNVAAGIEDALIERMVPPWNGGRRVGATLFSPPA